MWGERETMNDATKEGGGIHECEVTHDKSGVTEK